MASDLRRERSPRCHSSRPGDVFVSVARLGNFGVSIVLPEVGSIPILHGDHGMVSSGQRFFRPNGVNPFIHRF